MKLVSLVVPVYNTYNYLDRCLDSIVNQTYTDLEILLIDDGSTDNSLRKCIEWMQKDSRIIVVSKKNEKLGPTRNYGIHIARGEYIAFIDSDDWISSDFIEKLLGALLRYDADFAVCNYYKYQEKGNTTFLPMWPKHFAIIETIKEKIDYLSQWYISTCWNKVYRREWLIDNEIMQISTSAQDAAACALYVATARRFVIIEDACYYYWIDRKTSITNTVDRGKEFVHALTYSITEMKEKGFFETYRQGHLKQLYWMCAFQIWNCKDFKGKMQLNSIYSSILDKYFPGWQSQVGMQWLVYGSYNARWTAQVLSQSIICTPIHYCYTSLISQFLGENKQFVAEHPNKNRCTAVNRDFEGHMKYFYDNEAAGIIVDFLEERYDIIETTNKQYICNSEAFQESGHIDININRKIMSGTKEFMELWQEACLLFVEFLNKLDIKIPIYVLKMRLATGYGIGKWENGFSDVNISEITKKNRMFEEMERFFCNNCQTAIYIEAEDEMYYAQTAHKYGCQPYHLNWFLYDKFAKKIKR